MSKWARRLSQELASLQTLFHPDELAYLALTGKIEYPIRDRLAFSLHRKWAAPESLSVHREWNRIDLAIIKVKDSLPLVILEAKAQYTFDILKTGTPHEYPDLLLRDVQKVAPRRGAETEVFTLLLATHPHGAPDQRNKYSGVASGAATSVDTQNRP